MVEKPRAVLLVEGASDRLAVEALAHRRGWDLAAEAVLVLPMGGAHAAGRFVARYGPSGQDLRLAGLCDAGEEPAVRHALELAGLGHELSRAGMERLGFYVCEKDLEDELVKSLGPAGVERVLAEHGRLAAFRTYQKQPAHRTAPIQEQLRGFLNNWKVRLAAPLVEALDPGRVPRPLDGVLAHVRRGR